MSLLTTPPCSSSSFFLLKTQKLHHHNSLSSFSLLYSPTPFLSLSSTRPSSRTFFFSRSSDNDNDDEWGQESKSKPDPPSFSLGIPEANISITIPDEWGEKNGSEPESEPESRFTEPDPPIREDEDGWGLPFIDSTSDAAQKLIDSTSDGAQKLVDSTSDGAQKLFDSTSDGAQKLVESTSDGAQKLVESTSDGAQKLVDSTSDGAQKLVDSTSDGAQKLIDSTSDGAQKLIDSASDGVQKLIDSTSTKENKNWELKRGLLDSLYGSEFGFRASSEVRAEISELVNQLEAVNPSPNPTEVPGLLDGKWILVYTAFSELLPLLAVGATPLLKIQQISQAINSANQTVENSTTLSTPFATFSFSAAASFDVRSSSRIQVLFKEATFNPPEIKSQFDLPENVEVFGQSVALSPAQQLLNPVQEAAASISRTLYGLPPLKIPIPGERTTSWLLFTYVDEDFLISRGDGGIFVLAREGSPLLDQ